MADAQTFAELYGDLDPTTPIFWETVYFFAKQGKDIAPPKTIELPEASIGVQILELKREVALRTPTQMLTVLDPVHPKTIFAEWAEEE